MYLVAFGLHYLACDFYTDKTPREALVFAERLRFVVEVIKELLDELPDDLGKVEVFNVPGVDWKLAFEDAFEAFEDLATWLEKVAANGGFNIQACF